MQRISFQSENLGGKFRPSRTKVMCILLSTPFILVKSNIKCRRSCPWKAFYGTKNKIHTFRSCNQNTSFVCVKRRIRSEFHPLALSFVGLGR